MSEYSSSHFAQLPAEPQQQVAEQSSWQQLAQLTPEEQQQLVEYANWQQLAQLTPEEQQQLVEYSNWQQLAQLTPEQQQQLVEYANWQQLAQLTPEEQQQLVEYANWQQLAQLTPEEQQQLVEYANWQQLAQLTPEQQQQLVEYANWQQLAHLTPEQQKALVDWAAWQELGQLSDLEREQLVFYSQSRAGWTAVQEQVDLATLAVTGPGVAGSETTATRTQQFGTVRQQFGTAGQEAFGTPGLRCCTGGEEQVLLQHVDIAATVQIATIAQATTGMATTRSGDFTVPDLCGAVDIVWFLFMADRGNNLPTTGPQLSTSDLRNIVCKVQYGSDPTTTAVSWFVLHTFLETDTHHVDVDCIGDPLTLKHNELTLDVGRRILDIDPARDGAVGSVLELSAGDVFHFQQYPAKLRYGSSRSGSGGRQQDTIVFVDTPVLPPAGKGLDPFTSWNTYRPVVKETDRGGLAIANPPFPTLPTGVGVSWSAACEAETCASDHCTSVDVYRTASAVPGSAPVSSISYLSVDRGACSKRVFLGTETSTSCDGATKRKGGILYDLVHEATQAIYDEIDEGAIFPATVNTDYIHAEAQSGLWLDESSARRDQIAVGGFGLLLYVEGLTVTPLGPLELLDQVSTFWGVPRTVDGSAAVLGRYQWALHDGILGVDLVDMESGIEGNIHDYFNLDGGLIDGVRKTVPEKIKERAAKMQTQEIPDINGNSVPCETAAACADPNNAAHDALVLGMDVAVQDGLVDRGTVDLLKNLLQNPNEWICNDDCPACTPQDCRTECPRFNSRQEWLAYLAAAQRAGAKAIQNPDNPLGYCYTWCNDPVCRTCKMQFRGLRVNVYPDSVELVFRNAGGYDPARRESAVELALRAALARNLITAETMAQMCDLPAHGKKLYMDFQHASSDREYHTY